MAAKTPSTIERESFGSKVVLKATFADLDDGDTRTSGLGGQVWGQVFQRTDDPTTQASVGCSVNQSDGVFTFYPAENDTAGYLFVYING